MKKITLLIFVMFAFSYYSCEQDVVIEDATSRITEPEFDAASKFPMAKLLEVVPAGENDPITIQFKKKKKKSGHNNRHNQLPPAVTKTDNCDDPVIITFDDQNFQSGDIVDVVTTAVGNVSIFVEGQNPNFPNDNSAMIFDTSNPTGGDIDLGTPNENYGGPGKSGDGSGDSNKFALDNVLIVTEDGDSSNPDDYRNNGKLHFDFSDIKGGATLVSIDLLDVESNNAFLSMKDMNGIEIKKYSLPSTGDNGFARIDLENTPGVYDMSIELMGSGAIDNLTYCWNFEDPCVHAEDPNPAPEGNKNYNSYVFEFSDGTIISGAKEKNEVEVTVNGKTFTIHTSCSDDFSGPDQILGTDDDGYGAKDGPTIEDGVRVVSYKIFKYKRKSAGPKLGECEFHQMCGNDFSQ